MKNIKKILITILSLTLLFVVGCGDRPTGSIPGKGDALVNSVPKATGEKTKDFEPNTYNGTLYFDETSFDFTGDLPGMTKDTYLEQMKNYNSSMEVILTIMKDADGYNIVTLAKTSPSGGEGGTPSTPSKLFENATLFKNSEKYNAEDPNNNDNNRQYIEFDSGMTSFKFTEAHSVKGSDVYEETGQTINYDYGIKMTYTGTLPK